MFEKEIGDWFIGWSSLTRLTTKISKKKKTFSIHRLNGFESNPILMLKFSLSTHTSLNKPNACLLSYIHIPYSLVSSRQFQILNSFFHDFLMMIQIFLIFSVLLFFYQHQRNLLLLLFLSLSHTPIISISPLIRTSIPVRFNDTSGVYIKLNAELYHLLTLILHNFPIFFPFVQ